ncbi:hypothetical protein M427DRAFT_58458 [Gonapodya prolifera JEL478]|uniref:EF-hand domain-containing protein n=1 Tax=Gonapodya prolifera (strain JEL478) TaxID=1344416 RepID=A0A139AA13_GONPJ|nr:hypothetical protein M427DRAFT_58458 [Gonapodya prolifera JEL478]|eukprot:KXS13641.1 hypothetical protein M427DRAFT_58458 [Gonapodya prolifera JEL478]
MEVAQFPPLSFPTPTSHPVSPPLPVMSLIPTCPAQSSSPGTPSPATSTPESPSPLSRASPPSPRASQKHTIMASNPTTEPVVVTTPPHSPKPGGTPRTPRSPNLGVGSPVLEAKMPSPSLYLLLATPQIEMPSSASPSRSRAGSASSSRNASPAATPKASPAGSPRIARRILGDSMSHNGSGHDAGFVDMGAPDVSDRAGRSGYSSPGARHSPPATTSHLKAHEPIHVSTSPSHSDTLTTNARSKGPSPRADAMVVDSSSRDEVDSNGVTTLEDKAKRGEPSKSLDMDGVNVAGAGLGLALASTCSPPRTAPTLSTPYGTAGDAPVKIDSGVDLVPVGGTTKAIPRFHHRPGVSPLSPEEQASLGNSLLSGVDKLFGVTNGLDDGSNDKRIDGTELGELAKALGLPKYLGGAAGRYANSLEEGEKGKEGAGKKAAQKLCHIALSFAHDPLLLSFFLLGALPPSNAVDLPPLPTKTPCFPSYLLPTHIEPAVRDVVRAHPGLQFLSGMQVFQARYVDTVVSRVWYGKGGRGDRMTLAEWRRSGFLDILKNLEDEEDVNATRDPFSYKHFYVTYCLFWSLDTDHDMVLTAGELARYDGGRVTSRVMRRVAEGYGRKIPSNPPTDAGTPLELTRLQRKGWFKGWAKGEAEASEEMAEAAAGAEDGEDGIGGWEEARFEYRDFVCFLMSLEDKGAPAATEYWFRVLDTDGDGMLSLQEIKYFFDEQRDRMFAGNTFCNELWSFNDFVCALLDLVQVPATRPHVTLTDLKRCRHAGLFFDLLFDWKKYDARVRRMDPGFREQDDVWVVDRKAGTRVKLSGWDKFAERSYELLAYEEQVQQQSVSVRSRIKGQGHSRSLRDGMRATGRNRSNGRRRGGRWSRDADESDSEDESDVMDDVDTGPDCEYEVENDEVEDRAGTHRAAGRKTPDRDEDRMEVEMDRDSEEE